MSEAPSTVNVVVVALLVAAPLLGLWLYVEVSEFRRRRERGRRGGMVDLTGGSREKRT